MFSFGCPLSDNCPSGVITPGPCPSYGGSTEIDGIPAAYCRAKVEGLAFSCPNCGDMTGFTISKETPFQNWLCKKCNYYQISSEVAKATGLPRRGLAKNTTCSNCSYESYTIAPPVSDLSEVQWVCPSCSEIQSLSDVL